MKLRDASLQVYENNSFTNSEAVAQRCSAKKVEPATLLKKKLWHRCFPVNFAKLLRTPFSQNTSGRLLLSICDAFAKKEREFPMST